MASTSFISDKPRYNHLCEYDKDYFRYENHLSKPRNIISEFRNDFFIDVYSQLVSIVITFVSKVYP